MLEGELPGYSYQRKRHYKPKKKKKEKKTDSEEKKEKEFMDRNHKQLFNSNVKNSFVKIKVSFSEMVDVNPSQCFFH